MVAGIQHISFVLLGFNMVKKLLDLFQSSAVDGALDEFEVMLVLLESSEHCLHNEIDFRVDLYVLIQVLNAHFLRRVVKSSSVLEVSQGLYLDKSAPVSKLGLLVVVEIEIIVVLQGTDPCLVVISRLE